MGSFLKIDRSSPSPFPMLELKRKIVKESVSEKKYLLANFLEKIH